MGTVAILAQEGFTAQVLVPVTAEVDFEL